MIRRVGVPALAAALLCGCVSMNTDGPVVAGPPAAPAGLSEVEPFPPRFDASPEEIVRGFIEAASGSQRNYEGARSYLVRERATSWRSDKQITVFPSGCDLTIRMTGLDGEPTKPPPATSTTVPATDPAAQGQAGAGTACGPAAPAPRATATAASTASTASTAPVAPTSAASPSTPSVPAAPTTVAGRTAEVTVTLKQVQAVVDDAGHYNPAQPGQPVTATFGLARISGQWRISRLDDGLLIDQRDFASTFRSYSLYYPDSTGSFLVPDVRWYPATAGIATTLVQGLLAGPSPWLDPAVTSAAPAGTRLAEPAVVVSEGSAVVDLNQAAYKASSQQRRTLQRQLFETLNQVPGIVDVTITVKKAAYGVNGSAGPNSGGDPGPRLRRDPAVDPKPLLLEPNGRLVRLTGVGLRDRKLEPVPQIDDLSRRAGYAPAVSADGNVFAALNAARSVAWYQLPGAPKAEPLLAGARLTPPSIDPQGWIWSTAELSPGTVGAARPQAGPVSVAAGWLKGRRVSQLRVSRDGARAVLVVSGGVGGTGPARVEVLLCGVERDRDGVPLALTPPVRMAPDLVEVRSVAWLDEDRVVLLGRTAVSALRVWFGQTAGPTTTAIAVPRPTDGNVPKDATWVAAGNDPLDLYLGISTGEVRARAFASWQPVATGRYPTFAG